MTRVAWTWTTRNVADASAATSSRSKAVSGLDGQQETVSMLTMTKMLSVRVDGCMARFVDFSGCCCC